MLKNKNKELMIKMRKTKGIKYAEVTQSFKLSYLQRSRI